MMNCRSTQKKLSAYQDDELSSKERSRIAMHLRDCPACRQQFTELEHVWQDLGQLSDIEPGPEFYVELQRKIELEPKHGFLKRFRSAFQLIPNPAAVIALSLMGILTGIYVGNILSRDGFWPLPNRHSSYDQGITLASVMAFDPLPPGTLSEGYVRMANYRGEVHR